MNKLFFALSLVVLNISSKPTNFEKFSGEISNCIEENYIEPILKESIKYFAQYNECNNFVQSLIEMQLKMHHSRNDFFSLQKNFSEFLYLHEVGDRFFRALIDREKFPAIDIIAYFANLFQAFFKDGICFGEEIVNFGANGVDRLIDVYYDVQRKYYAILQDRFRRSVNEEVYFDDLGILAPSNTGLDFFDFIKYNTSGNKDLEFIIGNCDPKRGFSHEQKLQILQILKNDASVQRKESSSIADKVFYHYSELAAAATLIQKLIRNFEYDDVNVSNFSALVQYVDHNGNKLRMARDLDYWLSISFQKKEEIESNIVEISCHEYKNQKELNVFL